MAFDEVGELLREILRAEDRDGGGYAVLQRALEDRYLDGDAHGYQQGFADGEKQGYAQGTSDGWDDAVSGRDEPAEG